MAASAIARLSRAKSRALCDKFRWHLRELASAARFQKVRAVPNQNFDAWVWSSVRTVLLIEPTAFTSLKSAVYCALVSAGGPGGRKLEGLGMSQVSEWGR